MLGLVPISYATIVTGLSAILTPLGFYIVKFFSDPIK